MSSDLVSSVIELTAFTTGATVAWAIAHILCDEDDEIALERYRESSALPSGGSFDVAKGTRVALKFFCMMLGQCLGKLGN
jgi:hypothetical protein